MTDSLPGATAGSYQRSRPVGDSQMARRVSSLRGCQRERLGGIGAETGAFQVHGAGRRRRCGEAKGVSSICVTGIVGEPVGLSGHTMCDRLPKCVKTIERFVGYGLLRGA